MEDLVDEFLMFYVAGMQCLVIVVSVFISCIQDKNQLLLCLCLL